jgi:glycosyltransferase involved in cell wall biosynthesis
VHVSVVVCTYNRASSLRVTLTALAAQVTPPGLDWELVVVDNDSTDTTRREFETFAATAQIRTRYLSAAPQGLSRARNAGVGVARADLIAFTDDDVDPAPDWVARIAEAMAESGADILGGRIVPAWTMPPPHWLERRSYLRRALAIMEHPSHARVLTAHGTPAVWGANMAIRRAVFAGIGLFDPSRGVTGTKLYRGEEVDLVERALAAGFRVVYDPRAVVRHRIGADRMRVGYFSRLYFWRAEGDALLRGARRDRRVWRLRPPEARQMRDPLRLWLKGCETLGVVSALSKRWLGRAPSLPHR